MSSLDQLIQNILLNKVEDIRKRKEGNGKIKVHINSRDERTHADLAADQFSGLRTNEVFMQFEIWLIGRLASRLSYADFYADPRSLTRMYVDTFGIDVELDAETERAIVQVAIQKENREKLDQLVLKEKKQ